MNSIIQLQQPTPLFQIVFTLTCLAFSAKVQGLGPQLKNRIIAFATLLLPLIMVFAPMAEAQSPSNLGSCDVIVDENRLSVIGNEAANTIEIAGSESSVQVTCDGASDTFSGIEEVTIEAGGGDDTVSVDNSNGFLEGIATNVFGEAGNDQMQWTHQYEFRPGHNTLADHSFDGGFAEDVLVIISGPREDKFDVAPGAESNSVDVGLTDIATQTELGQISGSGLEVLTVKMGDGNDEANVSQLVGLALNILGQEGDDIALTETLIPLFPPGTALVSLLDLGPGFDQASFIGASSSELYEISGVPDQVIPDPEVRVTDLLTGEVTADFHVQQTEEILVEAADGDDSIEVNWDTALMSGLSLIDADLGRGNDTFVSNLLPVLTEPPTHEVQIAQFEIDAGPGDDQVAFSHSAGSWFDVFFTADMGAGVNTVNALLSPPPDDGIPGPEGLRQLQFNVVTGRNADFLGLQNQTNGEFFDVFLEADLGSSDDTFEAAGGINPCVHPGRGFDTARVTRNLLPFVTEFERIEILE
jgi:hypothetical protein